MSAPALGTRLADYRDRYRHIRLERRDGILSATLHTDGGSLRWAPRVHEELGHCFGDIAEDLENAVVVLAGEGAAFCTELDRDAFLAAPAPAWSHIHREGERMIRNLLSIPVPVVAAVNGPAHIHAELLLMSDVVIASETASFRDPIHFAAGWVPGDGVHVFWPAILGRTRANYFLLTDQLIEAGEAKALGIVNEVVPADAVRSRVMTLAAEIAARPALVRRYARSLLTHDLRRTMHDQLSHGLALEGLAFLEGAAVV